MIQAVSYGNSVISGKAFNFSETHCFSFKKRVAEIKPHLLISEIISLVICYLHLWISVPRTEAGTEQMLSK